MNNYRILKRLTKYFARKKSGLHLNKIISPTHMGINKLTEGIIDFKKIEQEATAEIGRRLMRYVQEFKEGKEKIATVRKVKQLLLYLK